jgi:hypothetical protein
MELVTGKSFFVPGSDKESWNKVPPVTRILVRKDKFEEVWHSPVDADCALIVLMAPLAARQTWPCWSSRLSSRIHQ